MSTNINFDIDLGFLTSCYDSIDVDQIKTPSVSMDDSHLEETTAAEENWIELWSTVLQIPKETIGVNKSFVGLGGDSILAIKLVGNAQKAGYNLTVEDLYEYPTIAEIAQVNIPRTSDSESPRPVERFSLLGLELDDLALLLNCDISQNGIDMQDIEDIYPCSPLQEALLALGLKGNSYYLNQQVYRFNSSFDYDRLKSAWETVVRANPILRTICVFSASGFEHLSGLQVVLNNNDIEWSVHELRHGSKEFMLENSLFGLK
ncbi:hypothetical protein K7432_013304 [Basidiobolus ranarum]|uniref:Carrier domain-containing protein n=1 Tax=Basidiobolus ranarum TaxID=34480 RepID=A0ABR2VRF4_9FUNG